MEALSNFYNVFDDLSEHSPDRLLHDLIDERASDPTPWVIWVSRPVSLGWTHTLPRAATLAFAPGAVLTITGRLIVEGDLDAGFEERFSLLGNGVVELLGPLDEIVADWWRPTPWRNPVELALDALWGRYARADPRVFPVPIRLDGPYALARTLRIKPSADVPNPTGRIEVRLRGRWGQPSDPPTFVVGAPPQAGMLSAMVSVEEGVVLTMEHVAFDAAPGVAVSIARACISLEGTFNGSHIEACSLRYERAGVLVSPRLQHWQEVLATGSTAEDVHLRSLEDAVRLSTTDANRLEVSRCVFRGTSIEGRAVDVGFGAPTSLRVRDSQFDGVFANAVAILGGDLDVTACQFASTTPEVYQYDDHNRSSLATVDILVRRWGDDARHLSTYIEPKDWPILRGRFLGQVFDVYRGRPLANTHVTITHCISTSPCFLFMSQTFSYPDTVKGGAMLTNVRHAPRDIFFTSVHLGAGTPRRGIVLQGCWFGGSVVGEGRIRDGEEPVIDLGTTFGTNIVPIGFRLGETFGAVEAITLRTPRRWRHT